MGLVNEIVAPEQLMARAHAWPTSFLENSPASLRATKELLSGAGTMSRPPDRPRHRAERAHPAEA